MSYVKLKHALSAIAIESLARPDRALTVSALTAYARRRNGAVPAEVLARDVGAPPDAVRRSLLDTKLFVDQGGRIALAPPYRPHAAYFERQASRLADALRLAAQPAPSDVPLDVRRGAALFNAGLFFECHEYFEDVWRASRPPERDFYHGLVQAAAGCYHAEKGNAHGAGVLLDKARRKLEQYPPRYLGVDVAALLASLEPVRRDAARGPYAGPRPVMPLV